MEPASLLGVDVDPDLVSRARANLREVLQQEQIRKAFDEIAENQSAGREGRDEADAVQSLQDPSIEAEKARQIAEGPVIDTKSAGSKEELDDAFAHEMPLSFRLWKSPAQGKSAVPRAIGKTSTG